MKIFLKRFFSGTMLAVLLLLSAEALAEKESCKKCSFVACLKSTIQQKEAMRQGYLELAKKWERFWVKTDGGARVPLDQVNIQKLRLVFREMTLILLKQGFDAFAKQAGEMASQIGAPVGCGYSPTDNIEMETDSLKCKIVMIKSDKAKEAMPCKELHDIAFRHEVMHLQKCQQRQGKKILPTTILTPAGQAREEAAGYAQEIAELKKLLKELKCGYQATGQAMAMVFSGVICDIEKPFTVNGKSMLDFKFQFKPSSENAGSVSIGAGGYNITGTGGGTYTIEGIETDNPKITVTASYTGTHPVGSAFGSGPIQIDLVPLTGSECASPPPVSVTKPR